MHIPDGYIPIHQAAVYWVIALIFIARSIKWAREDMNEDHLPMFGVMAAGMFVLQTINIAASLLIPVPMLGGVSWHVVGAALTAIIFASPWAAVLLMTMVLAIQSLFGDGGVTTMGANILNMGVLGGFLGYYTFLGLGRLNLKRSFAIFTGAWVSMILPAIALVFELWFAGIFPLKEGLFFMGIFQGVAGLGEGAITMIVFSAIVKVRPDMVGEDKFRQVSTLKLATVGAIAIAGLAIAAPFLASSNPDGLEQTASMVLTNEINTGIKVLFGDYAIPGMGESGSSAAILLGFAAILLLGLGLSKILKKA